MRSLSLLLLLISLGLFSQPGDPSFISRLMLEPTIHARLEPSIGHLHSRSGVPSAPLYYVTDTILVSITGHVKLDGTCDIMPMYGFQRKEGDVWTEYLPPPQMQFLCDEGRAEWFQHTVALIPADLARSLTIAWLPGEYRAVILLVGDKELLGPPFKVVER
jgi:hypothetical protein